LYALASNTKLSDSLVRRIVYVVACVIVIQGSIGILQAITGKFLGLGIILGEPEKIIAEKLIVHGSLRVTGTIGWANTFAGYMAMFLVLLFPFVLVRNSLLLYSCLGIGSIALLLSLTRSGWLSFFGGAFVLLLWLCVLV